LALASLQLLLAGPLAAQELAPGPMEPRQVSSTPRRWQIVDQEARTDLGTPPSADSTAGSSMSKPATLSWELVVPAVAAASGQSVPTDPTTAYAPAWEPIMPGEEITKQDIDNFLTEAKQERIDTEKAQTTEEALVKLPVFGLGIGARAFSQDETLPALQGSIRIAQTGNRTLSSISLRPTILLPYNPSCPESNSGPGCEVEYRLSATLDLFQYNHLSGFIGAGAAINKDSLNVNAFMGTLGVEAKITKNMSLVGTLNLIDSDDPAEFGGLSWADAEFLLTINFRI
jgi:hypothetical protein